MNVPLLAGVVFLVTWLGLVFVAQIASGWIHLSLVLGVLLLVRAIVNGDAVKSPNSKT